MTNGIDDVRQICDILDALVLMAKLDHAPMRAVSLLERAQAEARARLEKLNQDENFSRGLAEPK